jgi:N-acetylneuraminic acid mutarotase
MKNGVHITLVCLLACNTIVSHAQGIWTQKANFGGSSVTEARAFAIGNYGYLGGPNAELWRYDPVADAWTQMANLTGPGRFSPVAFSIGGKGYLGTGGNFNDFYEYDTTSNSWTQVANFGGTGREGAVGIAVSGKGYVGTGGNYLSDWWEFDPVANVWTQKANLGGPGRYHAGAFSLNDKGYVCTGFNGTFMNDLLEYDPVANTWTTKAPLPGTTRDRPVGIATNSKGYIITGWTGSVSLADAWEYDPVNDSWTAIASMPTAGRYNSCGFSIADKVYIGTGTPLSSDFWEYGPDCSATLLAVPTSCALACDGTATVTDPDPAAVVSYLWSNGQTTASATGLCAGTYTVTVTDTSGCTSISTVNVAGAPPIPIVSQPTMPLCHGDSNGVLCISITGGGPGYTFLWSTGDTAQCIGPIPAGTYAVTVTDSTGCQGTLQMPLAEPGLLTTNINGTNATCSTCANGSAVIQVSGGTPPMTYLWSTGNTLAFVNNLLPGIYTCCVTDANGCSTCDTVTINYPTGVEDFPEANAIVSPNPFRDVFSISWTHEYNFPESVLLVDMSGRQSEVSWKYVHESLKVDASGIPDGNYIVLVGTVAGVQSFRVDKKE